MSDIPSQKCPRCGTTPPVGTTGGICPRCAAALLEATQTDIPGESTGAFTPPTVAELAAKFPQLEILELIGRGGMGAVYKARQRELDRLVALKILPPDIGQDGAFAERFAREAKALARLNHPGIVTIYDFGRADGLYFFLMEFVDGMNLRELLQRERISAREALAIVPQICDALQFAHDQGIVHRDIKPENLLMDRRGRVKVADFGLAKLIGAAGEAGSLAGSTIGSPALTEAGKIMGTPKYMSPEQVEHPGEVDHRADIYALGVVLYQMLTGEFPEQPLQPPSHKVRIDVRLDEVVLRALEKLPERRYQQASVFKTQMEAIAQGSAAKLPPASARLYAGFNYQTQSTLFGLPWVHIATGLDPATGRVRIARGVVAIGGIAQGVVAVGGLAMGGITLGGFSLGIFSYGGMALGFLALGGVAGGLVGALGGAAVAPIALGGAALGYYAKGAVTAGTHRLDVFIKDPEAAHFFSNWATALLNHFQSINFGFMALALGLALILPWWLNRRAQRESDGPSPGVDQRGRQPAHLTFARGGILALFTARQTREVYRHMTAQERARMLPLGTFYAIWNSATFFLPFACLMLFPIPVPLNWIIATSVLLTGLAFYPLWWKYQARLMCASAWAKARGLRPESLHTFVGGSTGLMLLGVWWLAAVGFIWWQSYCPEGVWQPWLAEASLKDASAGGTACVREVRHYGQVLWVRMTCDPLPGSAVLTPVLSGPLIELPYQWPAAVSNVDCLVTTEPHHSTGKVIAGSYDLAGRTNFTVGFVLPDETAAATAEQLIHRMELNEPHGVDSPLFAVRRTLGKDASGKAMAEEVFGFLQLQGRSQARSTWKISTFTNLAIIDFKPATLTGPSTNSNSNSKPTDLAATNIVALARQAYATLTTYQDTGWTVHAFQSETWTNTFTEKMGARTGYLVEIVTAPHPYVYTNRYWSDGLDYYWQQVPGARIKGGEMTGNLANTINETAVPTAYFNLSWGNVFTPFSLGTTGQLFRRADERVGETDCYVLACSNRVSQATLWVGKSDGLIRRYAHNGSTETHEHISINQAFQREDFTPRMEAGF